MSETREACGWFSEDRESLSKGKVFQKVNPQRQRRDWWSAKDCGIGRNEEGMLSGHTKVSF